MSHLDDGQLHMVLDGALELLGEGRATELRAHLEGCPDCRARLEEEAGVRQRAGAVLDEAGPGPVELPRLEELRREASSGTGAQPKRRLPRGLALAWAASVVLALGAGLYGPELWERSQTVPTFGSQESAAPPPALEDERTGLAEEPQADGESGAASASGSDTRDVETSPEPTRDDAGAGQALQTLRARREEAESALGVQGTAREAPAREADDAPSPEGAELWDPPSEVRADLRQAMEDAFRSRVSEDPVARSATPLDASRRTLTQGAAPSPAEVQDSRAVPGLEILGVIEHANGIVRILQALPGADTLEVIQVPLTAEALSYLGVASGTRQALGEEEKSVAGPPSSMVLSELREGWSQIWLDREETRSFVILRAPRSEEFLRELAARLR